jgi:hypothetical protein
MEGFQEFYLSSISNSPGESPVFFGEFLKTEAVLHLLSIVLNRSSMGYKISGRGTYIFRMHLLNAEGWSLTGQSDSGSSQYLF